jgi:hypothetical protein
MAVRAFGLGVVVWWGVALAHWVMEGDPAEMGGWHVLDMSPVKRLVGGKQGKTVEGGFGWDRSVNDF